MKLLVTGSLGQLGQEFIRTQKASKQEFIFTDIVDLDISSKRSINSFLNKKQIDCIINCAAYTNVSKAEIEKEKALKINSKAVKNLVKYSEKKNIKLIHFSTDYVYNSKNLKPIKEENCINPQNYYGFSKRQGEKHIENFDVEQFLKFVFDKNWIHLELKPRIKHIAKAIHDQLSDNTIENLQLITAISEDIRINQNRQDL